MSTDFDADIASVQGIAVVPDILDIVCRTTGMGFSAVARVTEERWIACQVLDNVHFGLPAGGELKIETTICNEIRQHRQVVAIDDVANDAIYAHHHTPRIYGLRSYISVPIMLEDGAFFGTLCAIDSAPHSVNNPETIGTFKLFAQLIAHHLDADRRLRESQSELLNERKIAELREQFVAVLGHDLRNPIAAVDGGLKRMMRTGWTDETPQIIRMMSASLRRMAGLVNNVMDLARARLGGGLLLRIEQEKDLRDTLAQVVDELKSAQPGQDIHTHFEVEHLNLAVDHARIAQMCSNLLSNAVTHGSSDRPITLQVRATESQLTIEVVNSGNPIPAEVVPKLFMPFERGNGIKVEGLGLGLFIASEIAKAHGGDLTVASDEQLTRFTFSMLL